MPTSKEISGMRIKPVDLEDPTLFRLNQTLDFLAQLALKSQDRISSLVTTINSLTGMSGLLTGLHADRVALPASANQLTLFWEQDRDSLYASIDLAGTWTWVWIYDDMRDLFANRPADLGANDAGFLFEDTTPGYTYRWNGATWDVVEILTDLATILKSGADAPGYLRSYGGIPRVIGQRAGGTSTAPTKTLSGNVLVQIGGRGYEEVTPGFAADDKVAFIGKAAENWTNAAQGTTITLEATPTGSTTRAAAVTIKDSSGVWGLGLGGAPFDAVYGGALRVTAASFPSGLAASFDTVASTIYVNVCAKSGGIIRTMRIGWDGVVGAQFGYISGATRLGGFAFPASGSGIPWTYDGTSAKDGIMDFGATPFAHFGDVYAKNYSMLGTAARSVIVERHTTADTAGVALTVQAGGCTAAAVDKAGGTLYLAGGISQDTAGSTVEIQTATPGAAGSGDHTPTTKVTVTGLGDVLIGATIDSITAGRRYLTLGGGSGASEVQMSHGAADADGTLIYRVVAIDPQQSGSPKAVAVVNAYTQGATANNRGGRLKFWMKADAGALTEILDITSAGVGILGGSGYPLAVTGDIDTSTGYRVGGTAGMGASPTVVIAVAPTTQVLQYKDWAGANQSLTVVTGVAVSTAGWTFAGGIRTA